MPCALHAVAAGSGVGRSHLLPHAPVPGAVGAARSATSTGAQRHPSQRDSQLAVLERDGLALARCPERIEIRRQHARPFHGAVLALIDPVHLAIVHQQERCRTGQLALKFQFRRCVAGGDGFGAQGGVCGNARLVAACQANQRLWHPEQAHGACGAHEAGSHGAQQTQRLVLFVQ